jgi:SSS family solute:Na+ symporter
LELSSLLAGSTDIDDKQWITWDSSRMAGLPVKKGLGGAFVGLHNGALIVAGGSYYNNPIWEDGQEIFCDSVFVFCIDKQGTYQWFHSGSLPVAMAYGAAVSTPDGVICLGGQNGKQKFDRVLLLQWDAAIQKLTISNQIPPLPVPVSHLAASYQGGSLYAAGGIKLKDGVELELHNFWQLEWKKDEDPSWYQWKALPPWVGPARYGSELVTQTNGDHECLYLFSGKLDSINL